MVVAMRALPVVTQVVLGVTVGETAAMPAAGTAVVAGGTAVVAGAIDTHWGYLAPVRFVSHLSGWSYPNGLWSE